MLFAILMPVLQVHAVTSNLYIREIKITGDEFIVLQAQQDIFHLSDYWLAYSSNDTSTNIVPAQQLPDINLEAGQAILLTSDSASTCDAVYTSKLSYSLSDTKGVIELRQLASAGNISTFTTVDRVNWIKPSASATTPEDNIDLKKESGITSSVWYQNPTDSAPWSVGNISNCSLTFFSTDAQPSALLTITWSQDSTLPPAIFMTAPEDNTSSNTKTLPAGDIGLSAPRITELLPNPAQPQMDAQDEFIEFYNPNSKSFDLSSFTIEIGLTTKHDYTFPNGTTIPAKSFKAFFSKDTHLSLSNSGSQAWLLDPTDKIISQTDAYGTAKDGQSWSLGPDGKWYWSMTATLNTANIVLIPTTSSKKSSPSPGSKTPKTSVKGASTTSTSSSDSLSSDPSTVSGSKMHLWILAVIGFCAVLYALYEYRNDLANLLYRARRYRETRRASGKKP